jgi:hypothetical protein
VEKSAKSPSSQPRAGQCIAETASRSTGNPGSDFIIFSFFYKPCYSVNSLVSDFVEIMGKLFYTLLGFWYPLPSPSRGIHEKCDCHQVINEKFSLGSGEMGKRGSPS